MRGGAASGKNTLGKQATSKQAAGSMLKTAGARPAPRSMGEGVLKSVDTVGSGFVKGASGLVTEPFKGAQREGASGFAKGVAKGMGR